MVAMGDTRQKNTTGSGSKLEWRSTVEPQYCNKPSPAPYHSSRGCTQHELIMTDNDWWCSGTNKLIPRVLHTLINRCWWDYSIMTQNMYTAGSTVARSWNFYRVREQDHPNPKATGNIGQIWIWLAREIRKSREIVWLAQDTAKQIREAPKMNKSERNKSGYN